MNRLARSAAFGLSLLALQAPAWAGKDNDTLVWATASEVDSADIYYQNLREVVIAAINMCDTLMHLDPLTNEFKPLLAKSYQWKNDRTIDFKLREGIKFSNGASFGAKDVAYTLNHARQPNSGVVTRLVVDWIDNVEVLGPYEVRIHSKEPTPAALSYLSGVTPIYPDGHYDKAPSVPAADGKTRKDYGAIQPVCTGPYSLKNFVSGSSFTLARNKDYFKDSPKGQPHIGNLVFRSMPDTDAQLAALMTHNIDWLWSVPPENAKQLSAVPNVTVTSSSTTRLSFLSLDSAGLSGDTPMKKLKVRQAIAHAIDREAIVKNLVGPGGSVLKSMCHPVQFGCTEDVPQYSYDPEKAKKLLAEAGYPNGFEETIYAYRDRPYTEAVMNYLRAVGIRTKLQFMQWKALRPILNNGQATMAHISWGSQGMQDASASVSNYFTFSPDDYARDAQVRDWLVAADHNIDREQRKALYKKALTQITTGAYFVPLFAYGRIYAFNSDLSYAATPDELAHFYLAKWK